MTAATNPPSTCVTRASQKLGESPDGGAETSANVEPSAEKYTRSCELSAATASSDMPSSAHVSDVAGQGHGRVGTGRHDHCGVDDGRCRIAEDRVRRRRGRRRWRWRAGRGDGRHRCIVADRGDGRRGRYICRARRGLVHLDAGARDVVPIRRRSGWQLAVVEGDADTRECKDAVRSGRDVAGRHRHRGDEGFVDQAADVDRQVLGGPGDTPVVRGGQRQIGAGAGGCRLRRASCRRR